ncbi:MAG: hypothetical protein M1831_002160 [Alyxoria varia]|nr:MAG: hypothetical protein M1831_002160 [Alyxoria varia]
MAEQEYSKFTVAQIRDLFKQRGIPQTGLTRKAQLIERLQEADAEQQQNQETEQEVIVEGENAQDAATGDQTAPETSTAPAETSKDETSVSAETSKKEDEMKSENLPQKATPEVGVETEEPTAANESAKASNILATPQGIATNGTPSQTPASTKETPVDTKESTPANKVASPSRSSPSPEDSRKRKLRSATPEVDSQELSNKRIKQDSEHPAAYLKEDEVTGEATAVPEVEMSEEQADEELSAKAKEAAPEVTHDIKMTEEGDEIFESKGREDSGESKPAADEAAHKDTAARDGRFKDLFQAPSQPPAGVPSEPQDDTTSDRPVAPSVHPPTSALYIRNLKRPLRADALKQHLRSVANGPAAENDSTVDPLKDFHLDSIRTHAFAIFTDVTSATRARSSLHDRIWPIEREREPLWVDFVPADQVQTWIDMETGTGSGGRFSASKRWEVVYEDMPEGGISTSLEEATSASSVQLAAPHRRPGDSVEDVPSSSSVPQTGASTHPSRQHLVAGADEGKPAAGKPTDDQDAAPPFIALEELFSSTSTKPKLYYTHVTEDLQSRRREALASAKSSVPDDARSPTAERRGSTVAAGPENRRYTFEGEKQDLLVDGGPEFGLKRELPPAKGFGPKGPVRRKGRGFGGPRGGGGGFGGGGGGPYAGSRAPPPRPPPAGPRGAGGPGYFDRDRADRAERAFGGARAYGGDRYGGMRDRDDGRLRGGHPRSPPRGPRGGSGGGGGYGARERERERSPVRSPRGVRDRDAYPPGRRGGIERDY